VDMRKLSFVLSLAKNILMDRQRKEEGCSCRQHREQVQSFLLRQLFMGFALSSGGIRLYTNINYILVNHSNLYAFPCNERSGLRTLTFDTRYQLCISPSHDVHPSNSVKCLIVGLP